MTTQFRVDDFLSRAHQWPHVLSILLVQAERLERQYVRTWAVTLGLELYRFEVQPGRRWQTRAGPHFPQPTTARVDEQTAQ